MSVFEHRDFDHHELLVFKEDKASGLKAIVAVHNSRLGPAVGGCRMFPYANSEAALSDVLRLSRGMTYKSALAGLPLGGGKSVIIGNPGRDKSRELLLAMGDFLNDLNGRYITAEDSGTSVADMQVIGERSHFVSGIADDEEYGGDPSPLTAYGVYQGIAASVAYRFNSDLKGVRIAMQGIGNVGYHLAARLITAGATVYAADINRQNIERAVNQLGVIGVSLEHIQSMECDVFAPCALGGAIHREMLPDLKAGIIAGAANNQLASEAMGVALKQRGILYAPDYVINAGGIIDVYHQGQGSREPAVVNAHIERIGNTLKNIFERSEQDAISTDKVADLLAEKIFLQPQPGSCAA